MPDPVPAADLEKNDDVVFLDEKEFNDEWDKLTGKAPDDGGEPDPDPDPEPAAEPEPIAAHPDNATAEGAAADPGADPAPAVIETPEDKIIRLETELREKDHKLNSEIGRSAGLQSALQAARVASPGEKIPTQEETVIALKNPEAWKQYAEDYPESAAAFESRLNAEREFITETVRKEIRQVIQPLEQTQANRQRQDALDALALTHPDWEAVSQGDEFHAWLTDQPVSIRGLIESENAEDAAFLLTTFKTATGQGPSAAAPTDAEAAEAAEAETLRLKREKQKAAGETVSTKTRAARDPNVDIADDFDAAWEANAKKKEAELKEQGRL